MEYIHAIALALSIMSAAPKDAECRILSGPGFVAVDCIESESGRWHQYFIPPSGAVIVVKGETV